MVRSINLGIIPLMALVFYLGPFVLKGLLGKESNFDTTSFLIVVIMFISMVFLSEYKAKIGQKRKEESS